MFTTVVVVIRKKDQYGLRYVQGLSDSNHLAKGWSKIFMFEQSCALFDLESRPFSIVFGPVADVFE